MATSTRRTATPDPEDVLLTDSEPEDLPSDESVTDEQGDLEDVELGSSRATSTPNASLLSLDSAASTSHQSISGDDASLMSLLRETNAVVKRFDARLGALETQVEELGRREKGSTSRAQEKGKATVTDEIRVRHTLSPQARF